MSLYYLNCSGFESEPKIIRPNMPGRVETYSFHENPFMMMVCPHCGAEMVAKWENYDIAIHAKDLWNQEDKKCADEMKRLLDSEANYDAIKKIIAKEMATLLDPKNFRCICCGTMLRYDVGYYLHNCKRFLDETHACYRRTDFEAARFKGETNIFVYPNEEEVSRYTISHKNIDRDPGIYNSNQITIDFCNEQKIAGHIGGGDSKREYPLSVCREEVTPDGKHYLYSYDLTLEQGFALMRRFRERLSEEKRAAHVQQIVDAETALVESQLPVTSTTSVATDPKKLKQYLFHLVQLETDYLSLTERLCKLYFSQGEVDALKYQLLNEKKEQQAVEKCKAAANHMTRHLQTLRDNDSRWKDHFSRIMANKSQIVSPPQPIKPEEPTFVKPGLFNKKKVEAENEKRKADYQQLLRNWEADCNRWAEEIERLKQAQQTIEKNAEQEAKKAAADELLAVEEEVKAAESMLAEATAALAEKKTENERTLGETPLDIEVRKAEELLRRCVDARVQYERMNVIFPKYRNLVAYSTFYEYLETGRCTALSGPDGAYNLYESELRQNAIISQLSDILDSMEEIKANQYMVYSQLKQMNAGLDKLNHSMAQAVTSLQQIGSSVNSIKDYTEHIAENSDIIAYNTAVTAHYTKLNAELTDSLGYLVALH